jgi:hypothetical protein
MLKYVEDPINLKVRTQPLHCPMPYFHHRQCFASRSPCSIPTASIIAPLPCFYGVLSQEVYKVRNMVVRCYVFRGLGIVPHDDNGFSDPYLMFDSGMVAPCVLLIGSRFLCAAPLSALWHQIECSLALFLRVQVSKRRPRRMAHW